MEWITISNAFSRSWQVTKLSFGVVKKDKELLLFPILSSIFSLLYSAALLIPRIFLVIFQEGFENLEFGVLEYVLVFLSYFGLAFIATFFNVCVVYTAKIRFEGGNATFGESIKFAFSKIGSIIQWSLLSATVGLLMYLLDQLAQNLGKAGQIILQILRSIISMAWSIVTIFVVPVMVYYDVKPGEAIKKSMETLRQTWGESLIRHFGMGLFQFFYYLLVVILGVVIGYLLYMVAGLTGIFIAVGVVIIVIIISALVFGIVQKVYNTALFVYADTGNIPGGYPPETMEGAFRVKKKKKRVSGF